MTHQSRQVLYNWAIFSLAVALTYIPMMYLGAIFLDWEKVVPEAILIVSLFSAATSGIAFLIGLTLSVKAFKANLDARHLILSFLFGMISPWLVFAYLHGVLEDYTALVADLLLSFSLAVLLGVISKYWPKVHKEEIDSLLSI